MDRFFRGIGNRIRGTQPEATPAATEVDPNVVRATTMQVPADDATAANDGTPPEGGSDGDTPSGEVAVDEPAPEDEAEPVVDDDATIIEDNDSGSEDAPPDDDGSLEITAGDDDGTITSGTNDDSDETITFEANDDDTVYLSDDSDDSVTVATGDDGSTVVWTDGSDANTAEDDDGDEDDEVSGVDVVIYPEPEPEPDSEPEPIPELEPEPEDDQDSDTMRTIDLGDLELASRDFSEFRRGEVSEDSDDGAADDPGDLADTAEISPEDLRIQPEIAAAVDLSEYLNTDDDDGTLQMAGDSEAGEPSKTLDGQDTAAKLGGDEIAWLSEPESAVEEPTTVSLKFEEVKVDAVDTGQPVEPQVNLLQEKPQAQDLQSIESPVAAIEQIDFKSTSGMDNEQTPAQLTSAEIQPEHQVETVEASVIPAVGQEVAYVEAAVGTPDPYPEPSIPESDPLESATADEDDDDPLDGM